MLNLQSIYFGQKHKDFDYKDYAIIKTIARLAHKHHRQCENSCNGVGYVNGQVYYNGNIDEWAKREYGQSVKSAYVNDNEYNIFDNEATRIEEKINSIILIHNRLKYQESNNIIDMPFKVEFQGDPRGNTVKLYYEGDFIEL